MSSHCRLSAWMCTSVWERVVRYKSKQIHIHACNHLNAFTFQFIRKCCLCSSLSFWMWMIAFRVYIEWFVVMLVIWFSADSMHVNCLLSVKERGTHLTLSPHDHSICMRLASSSSSSKKKCHKHKAVHQHFMTSSNWKLFASDTKTGKNVCRLWLSFRVLLCWWNENNKKSCFIWSGRLMNATPMKGRCERKRKMSQ